MRIAVVTWSGRRTGGAERYLANVVPALADAGHTVALWAETDLPADRERIVTGDRFPTFTVGDMGPERALGALRDWAPDILYAHGLRTPALESRVLDVAPAVFMVHGYYGTCISGAKSFQLPEPRPCHRRFGLACFLHFYPRRCGGLNPITMVEQYGIQRDRLALLRRYATILTSSRHMRAEYLKHGFGEDRVRRITFTLGAGAPPARGALGPRAAGAPAHLAYAGRMERTKGGAALFDALPLVRARLARPIRLTLAGAGPDRPDWERRAAQIMSADPSITVTFAGWLDDARLGALLDDTDLLVMPSVWPEPFGLVGPEAGLHGVPAAAFAVGGIPEWLEDGVNGCLAPGNPPRAAGLADAITRCLADPAALQRLRQGAIERAQRFTQDRHLTELQDVLAGAARAR